MKAAQSCWTCKERKIGCDRSIPHCNNCTRTERQCAGYGLRLNWPGHRSNRRRDLIICNVAGLASVERRPRSRERKYLNFTNKDFRLAEKRLTWHRFMERISARPSLSLSLHSPVVGEDAILLTYYKEIIAPMCSTTRALNGFRHHILSMALSSRDRSATALRSSVLAIAAHHRQRPGAALTHKTDAMKSLYESLAAPSHDGSTPSAEAQLATSMMLCMYYVFDEQEGAQFHLHLNGAKNILSNMSQPQREHPVSQFLIAWLLYYDVLSAFAHPSRTVQDELSVPSNPKLSPNLIVGLLGCSTEVFESISSINQMCTIMLDPDAEQHILGETFEQRVALEQKLQSAWQQLSPDEAAVSTDAQIKTASATAELYRLASLLYLQRVVPATGDEVRRATYLRQAFAALGDVPVATGPWPVFIVACEARSDEERIYILETLDRMDKVRNVGNVRIMRTILETIWKQRDLQENTDTIEKKQWWLCAESGVAVPWFA
ncbi:fungal-specific transcription factor domain-containing protein [Diaporthe sp. PMI_573]|nr:fungal-specific transcription factor domain-containing protein [Diaporthaceae sp. PMI_573]